MAWSRWSRRTGATSAPSVPTGLGGFHGELGLITGQKMFATVVEPGEVLALPVEELRRLVTDDPLLGDVILGALLVRRSLTIGLGAGFRIIGSRYSPDTRRLRVAAARNRLPHRWLDPEADVATRAWLDLMGISPDQTPIVVLRPDEVLHDQSNAELAQPVALRTPMPEVSVHDLIVGPGRPDSRLLPCGLRGPGHGHARAHGHRSTRGDDVADREPPRVPRRTLGGELAAWATASFRRTGSRISKA
jgi:hypothetical protein